MADPNCDCDVSYSVWEKEHQASQKGQELNFERPALDNQLSIYLFKQVGPIENQIS